MSTACEAWIITNSTAVFGDFCQQCHRACFMQITEINFHRNQRSRQPRNPRQLSSQFTISSQFSEDLKAFLKLPFRQNIFSRGLRAVRKQWRANVLWTDEGGESSWLWGIPQSAWPGSRQKTKFPTFKWAVKATSLAAEALPPLTSLVHRDTSLAAHCSEKKSQIY